MNSEDIYIANIKWQTKRKFKFERSFRLRDGFKFYRQIRPKLHKFVLTEGEYNTIIKSVSEKLVRSFVTNFHMKFPSGIGELLLRKKFIEPIIDINGNLRYNAPIDWATTLKLWHKNQIAADNKVLIRLDTRVIYSIGYNKKRARFKNSNYVFFRPQRSFKKVIQELADNNNIDGFLKFN